MAAKKRKTVLKEKNAASADKRRGCKVKSPRPVKPAARKVKLKCCVHCPDFEYCKDRGGCCDYCDFFLNGKCTYGKKRGIPSVNQEIELPDYRGDDYGIDDYEAYEPVYE